MQPTKVNIVIGSATKTYYLYSFPRLGSVLNWTFDNPNMVGKVDSEVWTHTNEVTLTLNSLG